MNRLSAGVLLALAILSAHAVEYEMGGGKLSVKGSITAGAAFRTVPQDTDLLANVNSSQVGITGTALTPTTGRNQDDGNLNFNKHDAVSQVVNGYLSLEYKSGDYVALASTKLWYDYALEKVGRPWGNIPNALAPDAPLSDECAQPRSRFGKVALDNLYLNGRHQVAAMPLEWTLGYQKLDWGNRFIVLGGLRDLNPIDIPALTRPGMLQRDQETRISVPQIFSRLGIAQSTSIEGFYQFAFERSAPTQCGTFYSGVDWYSDGCNAVTVGPGSDRVALATGNFLKRADNVMPPDSGQFGLAIIHTVDAWATRFGLNVTQFHSRTGYSGVTKSLRTAGPPFVPGDPGDLNPTYYTDFPDNIRMFAATFETRFKGGFAYGELTYRPNQPLQFNAADLLGAVLSPVAPTTLRDQERALPPGGTLSGFERHKNVQLQLGAIGQAPGVLGAMAFNWGAEIVYKGVPDLPDPAAVTRFGRVDVFGQGPVNGVCPPPAAPTQCTTDGYVSRHAVGVRLVAGLRFANVAEGVELIPSLLFGQDVFGWSGDTGILQGRKLAVASLRVNLHNGFSGDVAWAPIWGGTYNNQRDRSALVIYVGQRF